MLPDAYAHAAARLDKVDAQGLADQHPIACGDGRHRHRCRTLSLERVSTVSLTLRCGRCHSGAAATLPSVLHSTLGRWMRTVTQLTFLRARPQRRCLLPAVGCFVVLLVATPALCHCGPRRLPVWWGWGPLGANLRSISVGTSAATSLCAGSRRMHRAAAHLRHRWSVVWTWMPHHMPHHMPYEPWHAP